MESDMESPRDREDTLVHAWRAEQLERLGLSTIIADAIADSIDWHDVAPLVDRGCPLELALEIAL